MRVSTGSGIVIVAAVSLLAFGALTGADAKGQCTAKAAEGTAGDEKGAKFQVYEALLQATDWSAWASWMSNGTTPGYKVNTVKYKCSKGGFGVTCHGQTTICKL